MRSWYEFGYNGYPKGEERQRFYRQRDDAPSSEEELYEDNETNDRPIYYFPLRNSEGDESLPSVSDLSVDSLEPPQVFYQLSSTVYEGTPSWWGSSVVPFTSGKNKRQFCICFGGVANATQQVDNSSRVFEILRNVRHSSKKMECITVSEDTSLSQRLDVQSLHSALVESNPLCRPSAAPPRVGHNAVSLDLSSKEACLRIARLDEFNYDPTASGVLRSSPHSPTTDLEVHLSLVVGGSSSLEYLTEERPGTILQSKVKYSPLSDPGLYLTIFNRLPRTHWTTYFPLTEVTANTIIPRMYSTLTPWNSPSHGDDDSRRWAYLGGTMNGCDPLPIFELCVIQLYLPTWSIIANNVETYGVAPTPRFGHSASVVGSQVIVFGGSGCNKRCLSDMYIMNMETRVWREVFFSSPVPRRVFHAAVILQHAYNRSEESVILTKLKGLCRKTTDSRDTINSTKGETKEFPSLQEGKTRCVIVILGGESERGPVHSTWQFNVDSSTWVEVLFPLLRSPSNFFLHKADSSRTGAGGSQLSSPEGFRRVILSLMRKEETAMGDGTAQTYFGACHGSLPLVIPIFHKSSADKGVDALFGTDFLLVGGIKNPPVSLVTHIYPTSGKLSEAASFWLGERVEELSCLSELRSLRRCSPVLYQRLFPRNMRRLRKDKVSPRSSEELDTDGNSHETFFHLVSQCVLEDQLSSWLRCARLRLRAWQHQS